MSQCLSWAQTRHCSSLQSEDLWTTEMSLWVLRSFKGLLSIGLKWFMRHHLTSSWGLKKKYLKSHCWLPLCSETLFSWLHPWFDLYTDLYTLRMLCCLKRLTGALYTSSKCCCKIKHSYILSSVSKRNQLTLSAFFQEISLARSTSLFAISSIFCVNHRRGCC